MVHKILSVENSTESWGEFTLSDGTRFKFKSVPIKAETDKKGKLVFKFANVMNLITD